MAEWGYRHRQIETELTDELFVLYLEMAGYRLRDDARSDSVSAIEAVRAGWIFAHDGKQYGSWRRDVDRRIGYKPVGITIDELALAFPDHVATSGEVTP